jgi:UDP-N-acetylglucosamine acyltransferase
VYHHATVEGYTTLGSGNRIFPYAYIGAQTHDLKYQGGCPGLKIGHHNTFREYVTVHLATQDGDFTTVGDHNTLLAYSHVAHDCQVGHHIVMSSHAALAGHVTVGDYANIGWSSGVHQFCAVGPYAMVAAATKLVQDLPPFMIADGNPAQVRAINKVGLERCGFGPEQIDRAKAIFKTLYHAGLNRSQALEQLRQGPADALCQLLLSFAATSRRGML